MCLFTGIGESLLPAAWMCLQRRQELVGDPALRSAVHPLDYLLHSLAPHFSIPMATLSPRLPSRERRSARRERLLKYEAPWSLWLGSQRTQRGMYM